MKELSKKINSSIDAVIELRQGLGDNEYGDNIDTLSDIETCLRSCLKELLILKVSYENKLKEKR